MTISNDQILIEQFAEDLANFADIGTDPPFIHSNDNHITIRIVRKGDLSEITVHKNTKEIYEAWADEQKKYSSFAALLASERYGNLRGWASQQAKAISQELDETGSLIKVNGHLNDSIKTADVEYIDNFFSGSQRNESTQILLIDGPAGIGKTQFITSLAHKRAVTFLKTQRPLILHVQSRGKTLSFLYDLMATSLQKLRLDVTFDQAPILAKYGLITIAIDGFDELADPDGYNNAWFQVSDLIQNIRGCGRIILAGRETFIGRDRVKKDISSIRDDCDELSVLTLQPPSKSTAMSWLSQQGWDDTKLRKIEDYLEPNSLALRPFFLKTLSNSVVIDHISSNNDIIQSSGSSILSILLDAMIEREIDKFGDAIEQQLKPWERRDYLRNLMAEAARDMAESNTSAISDSTLSWLVEIALPKQIDEAALRILKARSVNIAFLTNDERRGYRKFYHEKFYEYFLSIATIDIIATQRTGRVLARNILGSSFLETFGDIVNSILPYTRIPIFFEQLFSMFRSYPPIDRTRKNLGALAIASLTVADSYNDYIISDIELDECRIVGTSSGGIIKNVVISQLDCRGANLSSVKFSNVGIFSLIADPDTILPDTFPIPQQIRDISSSETLFAPEERDTWVKRHFENPPDEDIGLIPPHLRQHDAIKLLKKACRMRTYWLRLGDDIYTNRILQDNWWLVIERLLSKNGLLKEEYRQASGTNARFIHVRQAHDILSETQEDSSIVHFFEELISEISKE